MLRTIDVVRRILRRMVRAPAIPLGALLCWLVTFAVGGSAIQTADSLLLRPPPGVSQPSNVFRLYLYRHDADAGDGVSSKYSYPLFSEMNSAVGTGASLAAYSLVSASGSVGQAVRTYEVATVSASLFDVLGTRPTAGRLLQSTDFDAGSVSGTPPAVIGHGLWRTELAGDTAAIGRVFYLRGRAFQIVGIAPPGARAGEPSEIEIWIPIHAGADWIAGSDWKYAERWWLSVVARASALASTTQLETRIAAAVVPRLKAALPGTAEFTVRLHSLLPARGPTASLSARAAVWLALASLGMLLLSTASVAGLFLLKRLASARDVAVMQMLGASHADVRREEVSEIALIGALAGVLAAPLSFGIERVMRAVAAESASATGVPYDARTLGVQLVMLLSSVVLAIGIVGVSTRVSRATATAWSLAHREAKTANAMRSVVVGLQAAVATLLMAAMLLLVRGFILLSSSDLGISPENVVMFSLEAEHAKSDPGEVRRYLERVMTYAQATTGVTDASVSIAAPFLLSVGVAVIAPEQGQSISTSGGAPLLNAVTARYFRTVGTAIEQGRDFSPDDNRGSEFVVIVNRTLAALAWPGSDPIGRCLFLGDRSNPCYRVIGVVRDARRFSVATEETVPQVYVPLSQNIFEEYYPPRILLVRTSHRNAAVARLIADEARRGVPPGVEVTVQPLADLIDPQLRPWRTAGTLFAVFGLTAVVTTIIGTFGAVSYSLRQRERVSAIYLALGASRVSVALAAARRPLASFFVGTGVGAVAAMFIGKHVRLDLPGTSNLEVACVILATLIVMLLALGAGTLPLWRITRIRIAEVLRQGQ